MRINGAVAIVTGASRGIGRCLAVDLARRGATVALVARESPALHEALQSVRAASRDSAAWPADVTDLGAVRTMVEGVMDRFGRVDLLVNNAGVGTYGAFLDLPPDALASAMNVSFWGTVNCTRAVLPQMIERRSGHIVNMGAIDGKIGLPGDTVGAASKFAVVGFSEALALELRPVGVRVTVVNPGAVDTESFRREFAAAPPTGHRGVVSPERASACIIRAIERNSAEIAIPGSLRVAVLARHLAPVVFRRVLTHLWPSPLK